MQTAFLLPTSLVLNKPLMSVNEVKENNRTIVTSFWFQKSKSWPLIHNGPFLQMPNAPPAPKSKTSGTSSLKPANDQFVAAINLSHISPCLTQASINLDPGKQANIR